MERQQILDLVRNRFFWVSFVKRTDGTVREMVARTGVRKFASHGSAGRNYDPIEHNLITVLDMEKLEYRAIPVENIIEIRARGRRYRLDEAWAPKRRAA